MKNREKWKRFEELVAQVQKTLSPQADIRTNEKIRGKVSKRKRQIDIAVHSNIGQIRLLTIIECKDYKGRVDIQIIEAFKSKISDVQANKGIVVSPEGFTESAINVARDANIELYRLADTRDHDWRRDITVPLYIRDIRLKAAFPMIQDLNGTPLPLEHDVELFKDTGAFDSYLQEKLWDAWNDPHTNMEQADVFLPLVTDYKLCIKIEGRLVPIKVFAKLSIERHLYFKEIPIYMSGFENATKGGIHFPGLSTASFELNDVRKSWKDLGDIDYKKVVQNAFCSLAMTLKTTIEDEEIRKVLPNKGIHRDKSGA